MTEFSFLGGVSPLQLSHGQN